MAVGARTAGRWPGLVTAAAILVLIIALLALIVYLPQLAIDPHGLNRTDWLKAVQDLRATILQGLGGLALLGTLYFSARTLQLNRRGQVTERFTKAIEQLGSEKLALRLGGIYALEQIALDSEELHWQVMEVLTAFLRQNSSTVESPPKPSTNQDGPRLATDLQAVATVLGRRPEHRRRGEQSNGRRLDLVDVRLSGAMLAEADLARANLSGADLQWAVCSQAHLEEAYLFNAHLERAVLGGAHLQQAALGGAHLQDAFLYEAQLHRANLNGANLQQADLSGAQLQGAFLVRADLSGANLTDADLRGAIFDSAQLGDTLTGLRLLGTVIGGGTGPTSADLTGAKLNGADLRGAKLRETNLTRAQVDVARIDPSTELPAHLVVKGAEPANPDRR